MILQGDNRIRLRELESGSVHMCVTSPPYYGLRDYGVVGQIGLEESPEEYVSIMVEVFREVHRVLRDDGTLWLNLGDSYATGTKAERQQSTNTRVGANHAKAQNSVRRIGTPEGLKTKDMIGIPWRVAFALQADGWYLRSDIIWSKPNPMPESVADRPTKSHEYLFLLSKSGRYYYDHEAIKENAVSNNPIANSFARSVKESPKPGTPLQHRPDRETVEYSGTRNKRSVWTVATQPFTEAHFATFPPKLIEPCILAGSPIGGTVLDPFNGAGTTGLVAIQNGREYIGIELNPEYIQITERRLSEIQPVMNF